MAERELSPMPMPGEATRDSIARMIRVDHAGEVAAKRIYQGQLDVLRQRPGMAAEVALIEEMAEKENAHLARFEALMREHQVRPTALGPLWDVASYGLGVVSALLGANAAMAATVAVEEVISEHYQAQSLALAATAPELAATIDEFRADEIAHRKTALAHGAETAVGYAPLSALVKAGCRLAIKIAGRV